MSKFNQNATIKTTNKSGHAAYGMTSKSKLVTQVLTSFFNEDKSWLYMQGVYLICGLFPTF